MMKPITKMMNESLKVCFRILSMHLTYKKDTHTHTHTGKELTNTPRAPR